MALSLLLLAASGCTRDGEQEQEERDLLQLKIKTAKRAVAEIRELKEKGRSVAATCETAQMLFMRDLLQAESQEATKIAGQLTELCKGAKAPHAK
jgi:putative intracellular protease/amidase